MTQILPVTSRKAIRLACRLLREGEVVAFPTDTVYGVGANAFERYAVNQIFELKRRPVDKALPVFIAHGIRDETVPLSAGRKAHDLYQELGASVTYGEYDVGHKMHTDGIKDLKGWVKQLLETD